MMTENGIRVKNIVLRVGGMSSFSCSYRAAATYAAVAALRDSIESGQIECDKLTPCAGSR